ncbi:anti-anti-sigma factor [Mycolicibacterium aurum]|uniref:Anti-sigma factor antagonist n=2 Tax=Mycolicibacterium aurum TaxID=1791 RepID=A0A448IID1_MYCAU|nr:STAS domain-containing protein [Mycolicibacterium aurum]VEG52241.1 anti-anti-sigma factor [Mycolicibacterium aurum]
MSSVMDRSTNPSPCHLSADWQDSTVIIRCVGVIDMLTAPELEREIAEALAKQPTLLIVDLTLVDFLASCGMSVLIATHDERASTVRFVVVADGPATSRPMELIGLSDIIDVRPTLEAALQEPAA